MSKEGVDILSHEHASDDKSMPDNKVNSEIAQFWELESQRPVQITDVQGRLKQSLHFWRDVLHAPSHILECIEHGYHLPLKLFPHPISNITTSQQRPTRALWMKQ